METNKPLASIYVRFFNQREYVAPVLESVFAQTYRPLEIVISDDCSSDGSDEEIHSIVSRYAKTKPEIGVICNRNDPGLGMFRNGVKAQSLTHGELMIQQDGDDIAAPNRVERIVAAWVTDGRRALAIYHGAWRIGLNGEPLGELPPSYTTDRTMGAVASYSRRLLSLYPSVNVPGAVEDVTYGNRARFLDGILYVKENLLYYRVGSGASSGWRDYRKKQLLVYTRDKIPAIKQGEIDLEHIRGDITGEAYQRHAAYLKSEKDYCEAIVCLMGMNPFVKKFSAYLRIKGDFTFARRIIHILLLLPPSISDSLLNTMSMFFEHFKLLKSSRRDR